MNKLKGHIIDKTVVDDLCLLEISLCDNVFKSIVIDNRQSRDFNIGDKVEVLFKPSEVVLSKNKDIDISLQNRLWCKVDEIEQGQLLSVLKLSYNGAFISSIITTQSLMALKISLYDDVLAMVKTNEIMLLKC